MSPTDTPQTAEAATSQNSLGVNKTLSGGGKLTSANGLYTFMAQPNGNFVIAGPGDSHVWNSGTFGDGLATTADGPNTHTASVNQLVVGPDGIVINGYRGAVNLGGQAPPISALFSSAKYPNLDHIEIQNDGSLVAVDAAGKIIGSPVVLADRDPNAQDVWSVVLHHPDCTPPLNSFISSSQDAMQRTVNCLGINATLPDIRGELQSLGLGDVGDLSAMHNNYKTNQAKVQKWQDDLRAAEAKADKNTVGTGAASSGALDTIKQSVNTLNDHLKVTPTGPAVQTGTNGPGQSMDTTKQLSADQEATIMTQIINTLDTVYDTVASANAKVRGHAIDINNTTTTEDGTNTNTIDVTAPDGNPVSRDYVNLYGSKSLDTATRNPVSALSGGGLNSVPTGSDGSTGSGGNPAAAVLLKALLGGGIGLGATAAPVANQAATQAAAAQSTAAGGSNSMMPMIMMMMMSSLMSNANHRKDDRRHRRRHPRDHAPVAANDVAPSMPVAPATVPPPVTPVSVAAVAPPAIGPLVDVRLPDGTTQRVPSAAAQALQKEMQNSNGCDAKAAYAGTAGQSGPDHQWKSIGSAELKTGDIVQWDNRSALVVVDDKGLHYLDNGQLVPLDPHNPNNDGHGDYGRFEGFFHPTGVDQGALAVPAPAAPTATPAVPAPGHPPAAPPPVSVPAPTGVVRSS